MNNKYYLGFFLLLWVLALSSVTNKTLAQELYLPPVGAPFFHDTIWGGAADPVIVWNPVEKEWFVYYTQRRAMLQNSETVEWMHGSAIGITSSKDGKEWRYRGTCRGDGNMGLQESKDASWWAPEVVLYEGVFHMYVSFVPGIFKDWAHPRYIKHFISKDGFNWKYQSTLTLSSKNCIDPGVRKVGNKWYLWYKDETKGGHTWAASSSDLYHWKVVGEMISDCGHEAPFVFQWKGAYYLIVDAWEKGLRIYKSETGKDHWTFVNAVWGSHPAVLVNMDKIILVYHSGRKGKNDNPHLTDLYMRELHFVDGKFQ